MDALIFSLTCRLNSLRNGFQRISFFTSGSGRKTVFWAGEMLSRASGGSAVTFFAASTLGNITAEGSLRPVILSMVEATVSAASRRRESSGRRACTPAKSPIAPALPLSCKVYQLKSGLKTYRMLFSSSSPGSGV